MKRLHTCALIFVSLVTNVEAQQSTTTNPNTFFSRGEPTFIIGTAGDEPADRGIAVQVQFIRDLLFTDAPVDDDATIEVTKGPNAWPRNPVLYGGPHVNLVLSQLAPMLPFQMEQGKLTIGGQTFEGDQYRLIAVIPAREADENGPGYPEFLLYAGCGSPGVAEINAINHGPDPVLIADAFGPLRRGTWQRDDAGELYARFIGPPNRRIAWRKVERQLAAVKQDNRAVAQFFFPEQLAAAEDEAVVINACMRGLMRAADRLDIDALADVSIYVYPDRGSKKALTGDAGDGHAVVAAHTLHVVRFDPSEGGPLERLVAHEGTHVLTYDAWGAPGTTLLGEGVAIWASGGYGGVRLEDWPKRISDKTPPIVNLLGLSFTQIPEQQSYPLAGVFIDTAVERVGLVKMRDHLWPASASTWQAACKQAGTSPQKLQGSFNRRFERE